MPSLKISQLTVLSTFGSASDLIPIVNAGVTKRISYENLFNSIPDDIFRIADNVDTSKGVRFQLSSLSTFTTVTLTVPNASGTIALVGSTEVPLTFSTGLTRTLDTITSNISTGISGGQTATGGIAASENLTLRSTSHATKGFTYIGSTTTVAVDETNKRTGFGIAVPTATVHAQGIGATNATYSLKAQDIAANLYFSVRDNGEVNSALGYWLGGIKTLYYGVVTSNIFLGEGSGNLSLSGTDNLGFGTNTLQDVITSQYNVAIGSNALKDATAASANIAIGVTAMAGNLSSDHNVGIGYASLLNLASGSGENVGIGGYTGSANTTGTGNIYMGYATGNSLTSGSYNVIIGNRAVSGSSYAGGSSNTLIGYNTTMPTGVSFAVVLGAGSSGVISNSFSCGTFSGGATVDDVAFGGGYEDNTNFGSSYTIHTTHVKAGNSNQAMSGELILAGGKGTGTGVGGSVLMQVAPAGGAGSAQNAYVTKFTLKGTGIFNLALPVGNAGLAAGDLFKDTAANILAAGDYIVGMKA